MNKDGINRFYEAFSRLCDENDVAPSVVATKIGLSNASATYWKRGAMPRRATLQKLADYFHAPIEIFLSGESSLDAYMWLLEEPFEIPPECKSIGTLQNAWNRASDQLTEARQKRLEGEIGRWETVCTKLKEAIDELEHPAPKEKEEDMSSRTIMLLDSFSRLNEEGQKKAVEWISLLQKIPEFQRIQPGS